jgi:2-phosphoglycolate phosphatase
MPQPILEAVLFDLDGTLIDTAPDFAVVVNQLRQRHGKTELDYAAIRATVSHGARALVTLAFGLNQADKNFEALRQELLMLYSQHLCIKTQLFPGINKLLDWIEQQSLPWGIVTNKPRQYAEPIIATLQLAKRCQVLVCPDDVKQTKPHPEPMLLACQHLQCNNHNTLYIGDHRRDIEAGKNANMHTMAATYGYIDPSDPAANWGADCAVDHAEQIQRYLETRFSFL